MSEKQGLKNIKGIGPKTAEKLEDAGIESVKDLISADSEKLAEKIGSSKETVEKYKERAGGGLEERKKKLLEKAKELEKGIKVEDVKEKLKEKRKEKEPLVPIKEYLKSGVYIGTKVITPHMKDYIYKRRNDGIANIDTNTIDEKLKEAIKKLVKYDPEDFIVVCKREAGWEPVEKFGELTGVKVFTKKYPAGILTNIKLPDFFETEMVFICDPWVDKNAMNDAKIIKKKVFGLCDTNNYTFKVDEVIPCNNKSNKSLGLIFYILAREYLKKKGIDKEVRKEDFISEEV